MKTKPEQTRDEIIVGEHLSDLRARVRLLTWLSGLSWTVLVLFGSLLLSGLLDWLIHFDDPGLRLVIGLTVVAASAFMLWRQLITPLREPLGATFLASRIERRYPGLHSRVLSAVEFLHHRIDSKVGSPELQRAVVSQAMNDLERIDPDDIVEARAVRRVTLAGSMLLAVVALIVVLCPAEAATSVKRLIFPFANTPWPRQFELRLVRRDYSAVELTREHPLQIARGDTLELYVVNRKGRLPERVWFEQRLPESSSITREALRQTTIPDSKGKSHEAAILSWSASRGAMEFRVTGGDDDTMEYIRVEVVEPPIVESIQLDIQPPAYSGRPSEQLPAGVGHVSGLVGTKIHAIVRADKPVKSAHLRIGDKPGLALVVAEDRQSFVADFSITEPGVSAYFFELADDAGFIDRASQRYELRGIADLVPEVVIENPIGDVMLAPDAELPVKVLAKDDLGLRKVRLLFRKNDETTDSTIPLHSPPTPATTGAEGQGLRDSEALTALSLQHLWKMADLSLEPGNRIIFRAEATDGYDLTSDGHVTRSTPRTITIVSKEEKQKELAARVGELLEDLRDAAMLQQRARQQTSELQTQLDTTGELRLQDVDQLHRIELDQRQAASRLNHPADGVQEQARQLSQEFRANKLDDNETQVRLERLVDEIERLARDQFPRIERALTRASKQAEGTEAKPDELKKNAAPEESKPKETKSDSTIKEPSTTNNEPQDKPASASGDQQTAAGRKKTEIVEPLKEAQTGQQRAADTLQELQDLLAEWRDRRDVSKELKSLIGEQEKIQKESADLAASTQTKSPAELSPQERADLSKLAAKQRKVADEVDQFRRQLDQMAGSIKPRDVDAAERLEEARDELSNDGTAGALREAAADINENKLGEAGQAQQQALNELRDVERRLKREATDDIETLIKQVEQAMSDVEEMRKEQEEIMQQAQAAASQPDSPERREQIEKLRQRQQNLKEKLGQTKRKLERLRLNSAADAVARAQERLDNIDQQLQDPEQADEAVEEMQEVAEELDQAERDLALEKRIAEERLATEQLEKIEDSLKGLLARQQSVIAETERLESERHEKGSFTRGQLKTLRDLAEIERSLQADAAAMEKSLTTAEVFALVLRRTARSLEMAANRLSEKQTDAGTIALEKEAAKKIESLLGVLKQDDPAKGDKPEQQPKPDQQQDDADKNKPEEAGPPGESLPQLAQLKMLKLLQEEYLDRTRLLNELRDKDGNLAQEAAVELEQLAKEQDELAELTRNLIVKLRQSRPDEEADSPHGDSPKNPDAHGDDLKNETDERTSPTDKEPADQPKAKRKPSKPSDDPLDLDKALDLDPLLDEGVPSKKEAVK